MKKKVFSFVKTRIQRRSIARKRKHIKDVSWGKIFGWSLSIIAGVFALGVLGFSAMIWILGSDLPQVDDLHNFIASESTIIYDREGNVLYTIHGEENRENIDLNDIPQYLKDATLAIEDDQFYSHPGFDIGGIIKAGLYEAFGIGKPRGGSTITQQLVKNVFLTPERSYVRKVKELILAMRLEKTLTKDEILELYLNRIPYGSNAYGVQMAAKTFFDKEAKDLTLLESSILASLPKAPSRFSPYGPNRSKLTGYENDNGSYLSGRKDVVLVRMVELGYITEKQKKQAQAELGDLEFQKYREDIKSPHFVFYVRELLERKFGDLAVEAGGLHVYTTIDPELQGFAEEIIAERKERNLTNFNASNMALLSVDATNGQILSMVGSVDYFDEEIDGNVNVVTRPRSPGSSFKPFVYAAGFLNGYSPATVFFDVETDFGNDYVPQNYDGEFNGPVSARTALAHSLNIPAVKMAHLAGVYNVLNVARALGTESLVNDPDIYGISIGLGTGEIPLIEMVKAYTTLARGGSKIDFNPLLRIEDSRGNIIEDFENVKITGEQVLDSQVAYSVTNVLSDAEARPEGWGNLDIFGRPNVAKTGTSNKKINPDTASEVIKPGDVWTLGYTTRVVTGVWAGNNDNSPMGYSASGMAVAAPVWNAFMNKAVEDHPIENFPVPDGIEEIEVAKLSGKLPSANTPEDEVVTEVFTSSNQPTEEDDVYAEVEVDGVSGKLPTEDTPESAIEKAVILNFHSQKPGFPNWEEPVQEWVTENYFDRRFLTEIPEEFDDVHSEKTAKIQPTIRILSPQNNGIVSFGKVGVLVDVGSERQVKKVEYYLGGVLVDTQRKAPWRGSFTLTEEDYEAGEVRLTARVYDKMLYGDSDVITIDLGGEDTNKPEISFVYPTNNSQLPRGSVVSLKVSAFDREGDVKDVTYLVDGTEIGKVIDPPFSFSYNFSELSGSHTLSAVARDNVENKAESSVSIRFDDIFTFDTASLSLVKPQSGDEYAVGSTVSLFARISNENAEKVAKVEFVVRDKNESISVGKQVVSEVSNTDGGTVFSGSWIPKKVSEYDVYIKVYIEGGKTLVSNKERVKIRD